MVVYAENGTKLELGSCIGSGGEVKVYDILKKPDKVAKIYNDAETAAKAEAKIEAMIGLYYMDSFKKTGLSDKSTWPLGTLYDADKRFIGFAMKKISAGRELNEFYKYPVPANETVSMKERVDCLINLCDVVEKFHDIDQVIGDFNPGNITVDKKMNVTLMDADSFHISYGGKKYPCHVCLRGYFAPELLRNLKGTSLEKYRGVTFTKETDRFALALHCFKMLMNGCDPFLYRSEKDGSVSSPTMVRDNHVKEGKSPFFTPILNYSVPDYAPDIDMLPADMKDMFKRAFKDGCNDPSKRPSATEWKNELKKYRSGLKCCRSDKLHYYNSRLSKCPYCETDKKYSKKISGHTSPPAPVNIPLFRSAGTTNGKTQTGKKATAVAGNNEEVKYWVITLFVTAGILLLLELLVFRHAFWAISSRSVVLTNIATVGGFIAGIIGVIVYNTKLAKGGGKGGYPDRDYVLSVMMGIGIAFAFGFFTSIFVSLIFIIAIVLVLIGLLL